MQRVPGTVLLSIALVSLWVGFAHGVSSTCIGGGSVVGQVVDSAGDGIPGTQVLIGSQASGANVTGWFRITNLVPGGGTLDVSAPGYRSQQQSVSVSNCETVSVGQIVLALSPQSSSFISGDLGLAVVALAGLIGAVIGAIIMILRRRLQPATSG